MRIKLGFSPCPNDTLMLYALLHHKLGDHDFEIDPMIFDVEVLNQKALEDICEVTKLSFRAFYDVSQSYDLLTAGAALGRGNGPLLIADKNLSASELKQARIAIPGMRTTAAFLMQFAFPESNNFVPMLFSDIESAVRTGEVDAGVIIHETRFMYAERGFILLADLGHEWEERTSNAIPLGGFAIRNTMAHQIKSSFNTLIHDSIAYGLAHYQEALPFVKSLSQELDDWVIEQHIAMFVNEFSLKLGQIGRQAVQRLFDELNRPNENNMTPTFI